MIYNLPVKIIEEENAVLNHSSELAHLGCKALIVTGKTSATKCGALDDITKALEKESISYCIFDNVESNPSVDTIMSASAIANENMVDFVIGIGGGSPMDAAKSIAFMMAHADKPADILYDKTVDDSAKPVVCIPTTCGTGSEATGVSVLTRANLKAKGSIPHKIYPAISFCDYRYLKNLPLNIIKSTAIDAFCHALESLICAKCSEYSRVFARDALEIISPALRMLEEDVLSDELLATLMHSATVAGMAIAHTGTALPHALSYRLTFNDHIAHGTACAYFVPSFLKVTPKAYLDELLDYTGFETIDEIEDLINNLCDFSAIKKETVALSKAEIANNPAKLASVSFDVSGMLN